MDNNKLSNNRATYGVKTKTVKQGQCNKVRKLLYSGVKPLRTNKHWEELIFNGYDGLPDSMQRRAMETRHLLPVMEADGKRPKVNA